MTVKYPRITLNDAQQQIVETTDGSLIVSAGPGSGKSFSIVERIARMLEKGIRPESILATTFTRKAADVMNDRLAAKGVNTRRMSIQTMHAFCWRIIREYPLFKKWKVDDKDVWKIVLKNVLSYKQMNWKTVDFNDVVKFIASARNNLVSPEETEEFLVEEYPDENYRQAYFLYAEQMAEKMYMSFDDMLFYGVRLLQQDQKVLDKAQAKYQYVIIDEFQDSNYAQIELGHLVAAPEYNYMVVGDSDQAIYAWRGAVPEYMLDFQERYDADLIDLGVNYRCGRKIVEHSAKLIANNEKRLDKQLIANKEADGHIKLITCTSTDEEAVRVREEIEVLREDSVSYNAMRVLMRTNAQSRAIEEEFIRANIPFVVLGSVGFYQRKEIADLLSYLRLIYDPRDISSGERAVNRPFRFVGRQQLDRIRSRMHDSYVDAVEEVAAYGRNYRIESFVSLVRQFNAKSDPATALRKIVDETDYITYITEEEGSDTPETARAENVNELITSARRFPYISDFVEYVDKQIKLRKRNQRKKIDNRVQVMSIHRSKGDEAHTVFLIGANEGIIPHAKGDIEEERRLFYVAMTRAMERLYITTVCGPDQVGNSDSGPSMFIYESGIVEEDRPSLTHTEIGDTVASSEGSLAHANFERVSEGGQESI